MQRGGCVVDRAAIYRELVSQQPSDERKIERARRVGGGQGRGGIQIGHVRVSVCFDGIACQQFQRSPGGRIEREALLDVDRTSQRGNARSGRIDHEAGRIVAALCKRQSCSRRL